ncbi:MAG: hypothetical protein KDA27_09230 [Candidatus Eisenbacteria bacterium]|uniref:FlgD/Vpr Ig-like domain-containing protein n=1 Tax=Eiseniibacteriota bacterium TaxID=2212470 RepID=A0A956NCV1_UNCEI|nr:hypothetical protein [Candidatus Eisenbacteria bacterium]MCB9466051.1 hypothetical protein [Candidatus Eisenbacteria bacterium]
MRFLVTCLALSALSITLTPRAHAVSYNIDFGSATVPSSSYGAAGLPGVWNAVAVLPSSQRQPLLDVNGVESGARIYMVGASVVLETDDPLTSGDHEAFLDDMLIGFNDPLDVCIWVEGLPSGDYEVLTYALTPSEPDLDSRVRVDDGTPGPVFVGGEWPGFHSETVSYARHIVFVGTNGTIGLHSGEISANIQSGINGIQIRPYSPAEVGDGAVIDPLGTTASLGVVEPNPSSLAQRIRFRGMEEGASALIRVVDTAGRVIWQSSETANSAGEIAAEWDGVDSRGMRVPAGTYYAHASGAPPVRIVRLN